MSTLHSFAKEQLDEKIEWFHRAKELELFLRGAIDCLEAAAQENDYDMRGLVEDVICDLREAL